MRFVQEQLHSSIVALDVKKNILTFDQSDFTDLLINAALKFSRFNTLSF